MHRLNYDQLLDEGGKMKEVFALLIQRVIVEFENDLLKNFRTNKNSSTEKMRRLNHLRLLILIQLMLVLLMMIK